MKKSLFWFIFAFAMIALTIGCTHTKQMWWKPDFNELSYEKDLYECRLESKKVGAVYSLKSPLIALIEERRLFNQCLKAKGYELVEAIGP